MRLESEQRDASPIQLRTCDAHGPSSCLSRNPPQHGLATSLRHGNSTMLNPMAMWMPPAHASLSRNAATTISASSPLHPATSPKVSSSASELADRVPINTEKPVRGAMTAAWEGSSEVDSHQVSSTSRWGEDGVVRHHVQHQAGNRTARGPSAVRRRRPPDRGARAGGGALVAHGARRLAHSSLASLCVPLPPTFLTPVVPLPACAPSVGDVSASDARVWHRSKAGGPQPLTHNVRHTGRIGLRSTC